MFLGAGSVQAVPTINSTSGVVFQKSKEHESEIVSSTKSALDQFTNLERNSASDLSFPKLEEYDSSLIGDAYFTGKSVGYRVGRGVKGYFCNNFDVNCSINR